MEAGSIWVRLGLDSVNLETGLVSSNAKIQEFSSNAKTTSGNVSALGSDLSKLSLAFGIVSGSTAMLVQKIGGAAMQIEDLSLQTGITTDKLQKLEYAALLSGTSISSLSLALNTMTRTMGDAADEAGPAYAAFMGLGIDPRGRTPDEVFDDLAIALDKIEDPAQKAAAMQDIFGKNYRDMIPYLDTYLEKQKEIDQYAGWTEEEIQSNKDAKIGWDELTNSITKFAGSLMAVTYNAQQAFNSINPFYQLYKGNGFAIPGENLASALTDQYNTLSGSGKSAGGRSGDVNITINNPKGTPAENAAAVTQASRELVRGWGS